MPTRSFIDYEWDSAKAASNLQKHKVRFERVLDLEWDSALVMEDVRRPYGEKQFIAYAPIGDRLYVVVYSPRGRAAASSACEERIPVKLRDTSMPRKHRRHPPAKTRISIAASQLILTLTCRRTRTGRARSLWPTSTRRLLRQIGPERGQAP